MEEIVFFETVLATLQTLINFIAWAIVIFYLMGRIPWVKNFIYKKEYSKREKIGLILVFGFLGILASEYGLPLIGVTVNIRDCITILAGILGGPAVGIGAGLISGLYRLTGLWWQGWTGSLGYWSAVGGTLGTIGAGLLGAWLSKYKNINIRTLNGNKIGTVALSTFCWEVIHIETIVPLTASLYTEKTIIWAMETLFRDVLLPMTIANVLGIVLFLFVAWDIFLRREVEIALEEIKKEEEKENNKI